MYHQPWSLMNTASKVLYPRTDNTCLPNEILASVPSCAVACIQSFVKSNYQGADCASTSNLSTLCTEGNLSGLTIGEGSVQCIAAFCTGDDLLSFGVYNICNTVPGALPNTASVIVATLGPSTMAVPTTSTDLPALPTSIGEPDATQQITSVVMASGAPAPTQNAPASTTLFPQDATSILTSSILSSTMVTSTTSSGSTIASSRSSNTPTPLPDKAAGPSGLESSQVVGIALGASAIALITLAFIFFWCRHRKKAGRRRNKRRSMYAHQTPPPKYDGPPTDTSFLAPPSRNSGNLSIHDGNQRYYAGVPEDKRRSFWRRSIRPEDIGLAVSPKPSEQVTPTSASSHQSMVKLLPKVPEQIPGRFLWPAPLSIDASRQRQQRVSRAASDATVFDEDIESDAVPLGLPATREAFNLAAPPKARLSKSRADALRLNPISEAPAAGSPANRSASKIPLTPTYDNGNVPGNALSNSAGLYPPGSSKHEVLRYSHQAIQHSALSESEDEASANSNRKVIRKKLGVRSPPKASPAKLATIPEPIRKDSETTAATEIDDHSTPGEGEQRLRANNVPVTPPVPNRSSLLSSGPQRSPISDLRYPPIPRSAAVSRQAVLLPQPRSSMADLLRTARNRPTRDALVRNEASFMVTDTTSSDGYISDQSIDWPAPPGNSNVSATAARNQNAFKSNMIRLKENSDVANRGYTRPARGPSLDQLINSPIESRLGFRSQKKGSAVPSRSAEPGATGSGDLYFTVEM